jgi:hypothetical protein
MNALHAAQIQFDGRLPPPVSETPQAAGIIKHFTDYLPFVSPRFNASRRDEYAGYCLGLVDAAMIIGVLSVNQARELNSKVHELRASK